MFPNCTSVSKGRKELYSREQIRKELKVRFSSAPHPCFSKELSMLDAELLWNSACLHPRQRLFAVTWLLERNTVSIETHLLQPWLICTSNFFFFFLHFIQSSYLLRNNSLELQNVRYFLQAALTYRLTGNVVVLLIYRTYM